MYDLAILGGGPAGYVAAENAGARGLKTILFEKRELGGVCLNEGCIPTKTLLYSAKMYDHATGGKKYGITANEGHCKELVLGSIGIVTALNPVLGYENSAKVAKRALKENRSVYDLVLEEGFLSKEELDELLRPENMIAPHKMPQKKF